MAEATSGVMPHLVVNDGKAALAFYRKAFGAEIIAEMPAKDGKRLMHADMRINGAHVFLCDDFPEYRNGKASTPQALGGSSVTLHLPVRDVDAAIKQAADAGGKVAMAAEDMFWGQRYGQVLDPFGHLWSFGGPLKEPGKAARDCGV